MAKQKPWTSRMTPRRMEQAGWQPIMPPTPIHPAAAHDSAWPLLVAAVAYVLLWVAIVAATLALLHAVLLHHAL